MDAINRMPFMEPMMKQEMIHPLTSTGTAKSSSTKSKRKRSFDDSLLSFAFSEVSLQEKSHTVENYQLFKSDEHLVKRNKQELAHQLVDAMFDFVFPVDDNSFTFEFEGEEEKETLENSYQIVKNFISQPIVTKNDLNSSTINSKETSTTIDEKNITTEFDFLENLCIMERETLNQ
jgi:hypothetical protein